MSDNKKIKIVYIAGAGHSGTTLLDLALSTATETFSVGELKHMDQWFCNSELSVKDDTGATPKDSVFWSHFYHHRDKYLVEKRVERSLSFANRLWILLSGRPLVVPERYNNEELYNDIQTQAEKVTGRTPTIIVDSSKVLSRLIEINERTDFEIYVVHLIRDVRGVANSYYKHGRPAIRRAFEWLASNGGVARYVKKNLPAKQYIRVRYEDFAAKPQQTLQNLCERIGLHIDIESFISKINTKTSYRFGGNIMRSKDIAAIRCDTSWRTQLPRVYRVLLAPLNIFV